MNRMAPMSPRGYILPLTLAVLVMLALIAATVGNIAGLAIDQAVASRKRVEAEYAITSAQSQLLHMLAVLPRTTRGIGDGPSPIRADGRPYLLNDKIVVRIQDLRGLLPLNPNLESEAAHDRLAALLRTYNLNEAEIGRLLDSLKDYRDADSLQRLNGADGRDAQASLAIRNDDLLDPAELNRIKTWAEATSRWKSDPLDHYVDVHRQLAFNPNVAPARVIAATAGIKLDDAKALVAARTQNPDLDIAPVLFNALGDPFGASGFILRMTGPSLRIRLHYQGHLWAREFVVHHTPDEVEAPWRISRSRQVPLLAAVVEPPPPTLPAIGALRPVIAPRIEYRF